MRITYTEDKRRMAAATVETFLRYFHSARTVALPTGRTFIPEVYGRIVELCNNGRLSFEGKTVFFLDEFYPIDPEDERSNTAYMNRNLFSQIKTKPKRIFIPGIEAGNTYPAQQAVDEFNKALKKYKPIDLLMAGFGSNGHIANNEPGSAADSTTRIVDLTAETIATSSAPTAQAITMGLKTILEADVIIVAASGEDKAEAVYKAFRQPVSDEVPASHLQNFSGALHLILDEAAAKLYRPYSEVTTDS